MDNFAEQLVKRKQTGAERLRNCIFLVIGMLLAIIALAFGLILLGRSPISFVMILIAAAIGVGTFFYYRNTKVEYEYTFTNGELDIDKIINQTKRKELLTVSVSKFTAFGKYADNAPDDSADITTVFATDNVAENEYYADFQHESYGNTRLVFVPNEKMISNMVKFLHPSIKNKVKQDIQGSYLSDISQNI